MRKKLKLFILAMMTILIQIPAANVAAEDYEITYLYNMMGDGYSGSGMYYEAGCGGQSRIVAKGKTIYFVTTLYGHVYLYKSIDGGLTLEKLRIDTLPSAWAPSIALDNAGSIYIVYSGVETYSNLQSVYFSKSIDNDQIFTPSIRVNNLNMPNTGYWSPIVRLDRDNNVYIAWGGPGVYYLSGNINLAKSTNGGQTFDVKTVISYTDPNPAFAGYGKLSPNLEIGKNGEIFLAWAHSSEIVFTKSTDGGNTFSSLILDSSARREGLKMITDQNGRIYVVWSHQLPPLSLVGSRVYFAKSEDSGTTFSDGVMVAPTLSGVGSYQYLPQVAVDKYGRIYIAWAETTTQLPSVNDPIQQAFFTRSNDGITFDQVSGPLTTTQYSATGSLYIRLVIQEENDLYLWGRDWYSMYLTKVGPKDVIHPATSLAATDTPCDNGGSISLSWTLSPDDLAAGSVQGKGTGYNIYRTDSSGGTYAVIGSVSAGTTSYVDNSAITGGTYYYLVRATDGVKESVDSNKAAGASARNLPLAPTGLAAFDTPYDLGGSITLSWIKSADDGVGLNNVSAYNIYRYTTTDGNIRTIASSPAGTASYIDNSTVDTDTYYYFAKAFNTTCNKESGASNVATGQSVNNLASLSNFISTLSGISPQLLNNLMSKAENAIKAFDNENETAAVNILNALLNEVSAQTGKKIATDAATTLTIYVQALIGYIQNH